MIIAKPLLFSMFFIMIMGFSSCRGLTHNQAETQPNHSDLSLRARTYTITYNSFFSKLLETIKELPRWQVLSQDKTSGEIATTRKSRLFRFVDDVRIQVVKTGTQEVTVNISSASRVGKGDFGQNARNIRELLNKLDQNISN